MLLKKVFMRLMGREQTQPSHRGSSLHRRVLCIGGGNELASMPYHYAAWNKTLLSEQLREGAHLLKSTLRLSEREEATFDAVYCSHQLKNHALHEGGQILNGIRRLLKPGGFVHLKVPDVTVLMHQMLKSGHDLEDVAYISAVGPISYHDVFWGLSTALGDPGRPGAGHKSGYSLKVLNRVLSDNGFMDLRHIGEQGGSELEVIAAVDRLHDDYRILLGLKSQTAPLPYTQRS
jgi:hypothetical protein